MKIISRIYIWIFFLLLIVPAAAMPYFKDAVNTEKRELSELPAIYSDGEFNNRFSVEMNTWIQEHIGFRNLMVSGNSLLRTRLFGQAAKEEIIVGKNGWLFYGESVNDYLHVPTITERNASNAAHAAAMLQRFAEAEGSRFLLVLVANKNSLYGEYMPYYYLPRQADGSRELFLKALELEGVNTVDLKPVFEAQDKQLYQKTDSHWTYEGALLGYRTIMRESGLEYDSFEGMTFTEVKDWPADLAVFLYGEAAAPDIQAYPNYQFTYSYKSRQTAVDALTLETRQAQGRGSLVIYRDSFCNTMQAYLAQNFEKALFSRAIPYQAELIRSKGADLTVLQVTERSLGSYVFRAPLMEAPETELDLEAKHLGKERAFMAEEEAGAYTHLYGTVSEVLLSDRYRVWLITETEAETKAFEAFPIYEKELLGEAEIMDNGWSIYLTKDQFPEETALSLLVESGGQRYLIPLPKGES